ncbi:hypothetical protein DMC30DRAFT_166262 [Rhodotorula diobovata]|uniref:Uncharacterized protein n=1 Tax=Rhodotorula diobovata TaxID=5288 RepID=A0A5C5G932_9BASI|nr:hypothetical protein DMC30DRAFT_166262 [Rhodotorula diobovata]
MPLDASFFTLLVRPRAGSPGWIDFLVDRSSSSEADEPAYAAYKDPADDIIVLLDAPTSALLGRTRIAPPAVPNATPDPKVRLVSLEAPAAELRVRNKPGLTWSWETEWEGSKYTWGRDVAGLSGSRGYTLTAPDPSFPVVVFSPRKKGGSVEVLDHNLARVDPPIQDKKGLEIASLLVLCHFIDSLFPLDTSPAASGSPSPAAVTAAASLLRPSPPVPPQVPRPSPQRKKSSLTTLATNEIEVTDASEPAMEAHCERCLRLLEDPALLYLSISTSTPTAVPAVAALAERVKRKRYKVSGEEVRLFVDDDGAAKAHDGSERAGGKGKARQSYIAPPTSLKMFLSRIDMSDLLPNHRRPSTPKPPRPPVRPPINFDEPAPPRSTSPQVPVPRARDHAGAGAGTDADGAKLVRRPAGGPKASGPGGTPPERVAPTDQAAAQGGETPGGGGGGGSGWLAGWLGRG